MNKYSFNLTFTVARANNNFKVESMPYEVEANSYEEAKNKALVQGHEIIRFLEKIDVTAYVRVEKNKKFSKTY